jgi:hypothetical protein
MKIKSIYFLPPLAIARVGGSEVPLDSFVWDSDRTVHGAHRTVIKPSVSLEVLPDGSLRPYLPNSIQFKDRDQLRPVAPFFELWAVIEDGTRDGTRAPLTPALLMDCGGSTDNIEYTVTVANRKAQRRTGKASCAFIARENVNASDFAPRQLMAYSPHTSGEEPLVYKEHPIHLGTFHAIKPVSRRAMNVDLSALRVRFIPATGKVYGPPGAIAGPASPLPQGVALPPTTEGGRLHQIVPPENRILNPNTPWSLYVMDTDVFDPQPSDSYDGANVGDNVSWGVVDDSCDGTIEASVVINNIRYSAMARVLSSCPDYAPDRRPFYSLADDLADRDLPPIDVDADPPQQAIYEVADLFERAFETASMFNLDAMRTRAINENLGTQPLPHNRDLPQLDDRSMTAKDRGLKPEEVGKKTPPYANYTADMFPHPPEGKRPDLFKLPYSEAAHFIHARLCDIETLIDFLSANGSRVKKLVRPPYGRFSLLAKEPDKTPNPSFRDTRVKRDTTYHDMRMPPYMRDSDQTPLSITYRQHAELLQLIKFLESPDVVGGRTDTPIARSINAVVRRTQGDKPKVSRS